LVTKQGSTSLMHDPVAVTLLESTTPAHLAYVGRDGTPRDIPIWVHWDGTQIVMGTGATALKVRDLQLSPNVAITIDSDGFPYKVLQVRGTATVEIIDGIVPEYAKAASRYFGPEQGAAWVAQYGALFPQMARIAVTPTWVGVLDFEQRFPHAIEAAMAANAG
jgi:PPOX class probable F420-dependent enzyme